MRATLADEMFDDFLLNVRMQFAKIGTDPIRAEDLLSFADVEPVDVQVLPTEALIAEALHRHTNAVEEERGPPAASDLLDLALLAEVPGIHGIGLALCIYGVFSLYEEEMPYSLLEPPDYWAEWYEEAAETVGLEYDLEQGYEAAVSLLEPVLTGEVFKATWLPVDRHWRPER